MCPFSTPWKQPKTLQWKMFSCFQKVGKGALVTNGLGQWNKVSLSNPTPLRLMYQENDLFLQKTNKILL